MINLQESTERNAKLKNEIHFVSQLNHLRDHNGFRPGELHSLVGIKGGGKSTIFRTWINECLQAGKKVYVRLSEEPSEGYTDEIVVQLGKMMPVDGMELLKIDSELELSHDQLGAQYFEDLRLQLRNFKADILFFDNFSTSELSEANIQMQSKSAKELRKLAEKLKIPVVVASHTVKGFKSTTIASGDEVRGSMTLINTSAYVYSINVLFGHAEKATVLFVDKARYHSKSNKSLYRLHHHESYGLFVKDELTSRAMVAQLLKGAI